MSGKEGWVNRLGLDAMDMKRRRILAKLRRFENVGYDFYPCTLV